MIINNKMGHNCRGRGHGFGGQFRGWGCRLTMPRQIVLDILEKHKGHLSVEEIFRIARESHPGIGIATVYRTLDLLAEKHLVHAHDFGDGRTRYEIARDTSSHEHHHHLVCNSCRKVVEYQDFLEDEVALVRKTEKELARKFNFKITDHMIQFHGLCAKCQKQS